MAGRKIAIAVDESELSLHVVRFAAHQILKDADEVHLIGVVTPPPYTAIPPLSTTGSATASYINYEQTRKEDETRIKEQLAVLKSEVGLPDRCHIHVLPGGSIGGAITAWCEQVKPDILVLGSRGLGTLKDALLTVVGLGSVSTHCIHNAHIPVCVVRRATGSEETKPTGKKVLVSIDDSDASTAALEWAVQNVLKPEDELHLVSVAPPVPFPISEADEPDDLTEVTQDAFRAEYRGAVEHATRIVSNAVNKTITQLKIATDDATAAHTLEFQELHNLEKVTMNYAKDTVHKAVELAQKQVPEQKICYKAMEAEGGASDVGESLKHYVSANHIDLAVMGARGMGAAKRALMNVIGLGSVSDWCAHNLECPVIIVKHH